MDVANIEKFTLVSYTYVPLARVSAIVVVLYFQEIHLRKKNDFFFWEMAIVKGEKKRLKKRDENFIQSHGFPEEMVGRCRLHSKVSPEQAIHKALKKIAQSRMFAATLQPPWP